MAAPAIRYHISLPDRAAHLVHVSVEIDKLGSPAEVRLPGWIPGSYLVRDFARHVQGFAGYDAADRPLAWRKTRKDTWEVDIQPGGPARLDFDVYANELTVRTSHVDATHAFINPANLLPYGAGRTGPEHLSLEVELPVGWKLHTGLAADERDPNVLLADDYDELVDCPLHATSQPPLAFEVEETPHWVSLWGRGNLDPERLAADLGRIVSTTAALFGRLPYDRYVFFLLLTDGARGGLEHRNSTALMVPRFSFRPGKTYEGALQLICHEFFHTWNVKRIRPEALARIDYGGENYTRLLWAMEGVTEYYTSLLLRRAGLITEERYLEILSEQMTQLAETPGRHHQSLEEASFDAWIKHYRPDEHSVNSSVSYYLKGALASLVLDLEMRKRTNGRRGLDDLMRLLWERYGLTGQGVPEDGYQPAVEEVAGGDWTEFFDRAVRGRGDLDYAPALGSAGLRIDWRAERDSPRAWLGIRTRRDGERTRVANVLSDGPAHGSGLSAGDELLALDGFKVDDSTLSDRLRDYEPGATVTLAVFHRDELASIPIMLVERPATKAAVQRVARPTVRQQALYQDWIGARGG